MSNANSEASSPVPQQDQLLPGHKRNWSDGSKMSSSSEKISQAPKTHPPTKIVGVLSELKDDIVACPQSCNASVTGSSRGLPCIGPTSGMGDIYIEQNGKFIKAPKELIDSPDFYKKTVYLEEVGDPGASTPLDMAIMIEKGCSTISRILLGILGGVALLELLLISLIHISLEPPGNIQSGEFHAILAEIASTIYFIMFPICLVSLFDWLDLAHVDFQHFVDTLLRRKIFFLILIYFVGYILFLIAVPYNDFIIYSWTNKLAFSQQDVLKYIDKWQLLSLIFCTLCVFGWFIVALTRNEDLFYIHLIGMKKYEDEEAHLTFENQLACHQLYC